jgi:hypothetical protein
MIQSLTTTSFGVWSALSPMAILRITIILRPLPIFRNGRTLSRKMWENMRGGGIKRLVHGTLRDLARVKNAPRNVRIQRLTDASGRERNIQTSPQHCSVPYSRGHQCGDVVVDYQYILKLHMHTTNYLRLCIQFLLDKFAPCLKGKYILLARGHPYSGGRYPPWTGKKSSHTNLH